MKKQVLIMRPFRAEHLTRFTGTDGFEFRYIQQPSAEEIAQAEVLLGVPSMERLREVTVLQRTDPRSVRLRLIQLTNAGVDSYAAGKDDFPENVTLASLSGAFGPGISEYVLTMVLALYKQVPEYLAHQRVHQWKDAGQQESPEGKNVLILGTGDIGRAVARRFAPFHAHCIGFRRNASQSLPEFERIVGPEELDQALAGADIVVGALPSTAQTRGLLGKERLHRLKKTALLVNIGRGNLIDTAELAAMLSEGELYGAALDVTDPEPLPADHPLWRCERCIITPHISGASFDHLELTEERLFSIIRENLARYRDGRTLRNRIDLERGYRNTMEDRAEEIPDRSQAEKMHETLTVRPSGPEDLDRMLEIYAYARAFMKRTGNPHQWQSYPEREVLERDQQQRVSYVICCGEKIVGTFALIPGEDPTYLEIEDGAWLNDEFYATIHRIAGDGSVRGILRTALEYAFSRIENVRIDTHPQNTVMQHLLAGLNFAYCGKIYITDDFEERSVRLAYQKKRSSL